MYHGTLTKYVDGFHNRILDKKWWRATDRDFGAGFYTTISLKQAKTWALQSAEKDLDMDAQGAVLKIEINPHHFPQNLKSLIFLGDTSPEWVQFIIDHRYECYEGYDPCGEDLHPSLIVGQMADNKMDIVRDRFKRLAQQPTGKAKYDWFYHQIVQDKFDHILDALELGNQITFCDESLNKALILSHYFTYDNIRKEWVEHESRAERV
ncbi:hypothetical protein D3C77_517470 [compost metagenome]